MTRRARRWLVVAALGSALAVALWLGRSTLLASWAHWLDVGTPPQKSDYVLVLGGGEHSRPFGAAALVEAGMADHVLLAHVPRTIAGRVANLEELSKLALAARGVGAERVTVLDGAVDNTSDEADASGAVHGFKPGPNGHGADEYVSLETHPFHLPHHAA